MGNSVTNATANTACAVGSKPAPTASGSGGNASAAVPLQPSGAAVLAAEPVASDGVRWAVRASCVAGLAGMVLMAVAVFYLFGGPGIVANSLEGDLAESLGTIDAEGEANQTLNGTALLDADVVSSDGQVIRYSSRFDSSALVVQGTILACLVFVGGFALAALSLVCLVRAGGCGGSDAAGDEAELARLERKVDDLAGKAEDRDKAIAKIAGFLKDGRAAGGGSDAA